MSRPTRDELIAMEVREEADLAITFLASNPAGRTTVTREVTRSILLRTGGEIVVGGYALDIDAKHLGAGVYRLSLKERAEAPHA